MRTLVTVTSAAILLSLQSAAFSKHAMAEHAEANEAQEQGSANDVTAYACPLGHIPLAAKPGSCPVCGIRLVGSDKKLQEATIEGDRNGEKELLPCQGCHQRFEGEWRISYVDDPGYSGRMTFDCTGNTIQVRGEIFRNGRRVGYYVTRNIACPPLPFPPQGIDMTFDYQVQNAARSPVRDGTMTLHLFLQNNASRINARYRDVTGDEGMMIFARETNLHGLREFDAEEEGNSVKRPSSRQGD